MCIVICANALSGAHSTIVTSLQGTTGHSVAEAGWYHAVMEHHPAAPLYVPLEKLYLWPGSSLKLSLLLVSRGPPSIAVSTSACLGWACA